MPPVCLVITPSVFLLDERVFMSLGILRVAAVLESEGRAVEVVDLSGIENYEEVICLHAAQSAATCFGVTATTPQMPAAVKIAAAIRSIQPEARIILGGPHVTLVNAAAKREKATGIEGRATSAMAILRREFDVLVAGDGEEAIAVALQPQPPAIVDADEPRSPLFLTNAALSAMPFPARHLVDVESYRYTVDGHRALSLIAQLGCPFECGFCGGRSSPTLRRVRTRTQESIIAEMISLHQQYGTTGFMFYDDELNVNRGMVTLMRGIREAQEQLGVEWRLRGFIKAELFTDDQAAELYGAGFRWILVGFESGSPRILDNINKKSTRDDNTRCLETAARHGLKVKALMSIGHPGESPETVRDSHDWLLASRPADFDVSIITTYPGTPYYDEAVRHQSLPDVWTYTYRKTGDHLHAYEVDFTRIAEYYKGDPDGGYQAYVFTDAMTSLELVSARGFVESDVRARLGIRFNAHGSALRYEHSMGQPGTLPLSILRQSQGARSGEGADVRPPGRRAWTMTVRGNIET